MRSFFHSFGMPLLLALIFSQTTSLAFADDPPPPPDSQPTSAPTSQRTQLNIPAPVPTPTQKLTYKMHGVTIADPYRWLENVKDPKVQAWQKAHQARTRKVLDQIKARKTIIGELRKLYKTNSNSTPTVKGNYYFFFRKEGLKNQTVLYVREGSFDAKPRKLLDPNTLSKDGTVAIQRISPSPDGKLLSYCLAAKGSDRSTLRILNVETGKHLKDEIHHLRWPTAVWNADASGFYYVKYPPKGTVPKKDLNYYRRIFFHKLGDDPKNDHLIFGEGRKKESWVSPYASHDHRYIFISVSTDWTRNDLYYRPMGSNGPFLPLARGLKGRFDADVIGGKFYIYTTYKAPRGRILVTDVAKPSPKHWKDFVPESKGVLKGMKLIDNNKFVLQYSEDVTSKLTLIDMKGKTIRDIPLPTKGTTYGMSGRYDKDELFFKFTSWIYPSTAYRYSVKTNKLVMLEKMKLPVDLSKYKTHQVFYRSKDGTRIPMFIVHKKGLVLDGNNPTELYGYGGFNVSIRPYFIASLFPWLDRGGIFAVANLRGGGEYGDKWHKAGRRDKKQNVYDDFTSAANWLFTHQYTRPKRLAIRGGSNGGLLVAAVMTQQPDLFGAVICQVPLTDMIRYPISTVARLWIPEYGNPTKKKEFQWLWSYSPYHKLRKGTPYPKTLVMTADHDDRVDPFHARKFAAALQANITPDRPVLLRIESKAGHGAGTPLTKRIESTADRYAFLLWALDMPLK